MSHHKTRKLRLLDQVLGNWNKTRFYTFLGPYQFYDVTLLSSCGLSTLYPLLWTFDKALKSGPISQCFALNIFIPPFLLLKLSVLTGEYTFAMATSYVQLWPKTLHFDPTLFSYPLPQISVATKWNVGNSASVLKMLYKLHIVATVRCQWLDVLPFF